MVSENIIYSAYTPAWLVAFANISGQFKLPGRFNKKICIGLQFMLDEILFITSPLYKVIESLQNYLTLYQKYKKKRLF